MSLLKSCYYHLLSQRESQLPPASQEVLQDQQVHLTQAHLKLLPLHWGLEHVRFSSSPLRVESLFSPLHFLHQSCWLLKQLFLGSSSWHRIPMLGSLMWGSDSSFLGENLCDFYYPPARRSPTWAWESPTHVCEFWLYYIFLTHLIMVPYMNL